MNAQKVIKIGLGNHRDDPSEKEMKIIRGLKGIDLKKFTMEVKTVKARNIDGVIKGKRG